MNVLVHRLADGPAPAGTVALSKAFRLTPDGEEKHCAHCDEWWPADGEFFVSAPSQNRGLSTWCKACLCEDRNARRRPVCLGRRRNQPLNETDQDQPHEHHSAPHPVPAWPGRAA